MLDARTRVVAGVTVIEHELQVSSEPCEGHEPALRGYAFSQLRAGRIRVTGALRSVVLEPGSFATWRPTKPCGVEVLERARLVTFLFEERAFGQRFHQTWEGCLPIAPGSPLCSLLAGFFDALIAQLDSLPESYQVAAVSMARELVLNAAAAEQAQSGAATGPREALTRRIFEYTERRLQDHTLSPASIAEAHGISLRYLHLLFSLRGLKVASWIRGRRLERCREALQNHDDSRTVAQIAHSWGFGDTSHFSRLFRKTFGHAPNSYRRNAQRTPKRASRSAAPKGS